MQWGSAYAHEALHDYFYSLGKPQELPVERKPEVLKKHIKKDGRR